MELLILIPKETYNTCGQKSSITKVNNFSIIQMRVMVLVHCISPHRDLFTTEVSS